MNTFFATAVAWIALLLVAPAMSAAPRIKDIILATTTSTQDAGLLDVLVPRFEKLTGFRIKTIAVGSGQAIAMGQRGEADVLLVHSPDAEKQFVANGFGLQRRRVMHNDFIVVGPPADPAAIRAAGSALEGFHRIANVRAIFVSRGDHSGTHTQEKKLWQAAGLNPEGQTWYQQTGLGMGQTLNVTAEKNAYTLTDRATYLALRKSLGLAILSEGDAALLNVYHVIEVNPTRFPKVNTSGAKAFGDFLLSREAQKLIAVFGVDKFGSPLFFPDAGKKDE